MSCAVLHEFPKRPRSAGPCLNEAKGVPFSEISDIVNDENVNTLIA